MTRTALHEDRFTSEDRERIAARLDELADAQLCVGADTAAANGCHWTRHLGIFTSAPARSRARCSGPRIATLCAILLLVVSGLPGWDRRPADILTVGAIMGPSAA
jgi:hypothetical protein